MSLSTTVILCKRTLLYLTTLTLVVSTIAITVQILHLDTVLTHFHVPFKLFLAGCTLYGLIGGIAANLFSIPLTKTIYKIKKPHPSKPFEKFLIDTVEEYTTRLGLAQTPTLGIYRSPELNSLVVGFSSKHMLIAVSSHLLTHLSQPALNALIAHKMTQIANGNAATLGYLRGILQMFTSFLAYAIGLVLARILPYFHTDSKTRKLLALIDSVLRVIFVIIFTFLGYVFVVATTRWSLYRADQKCASIAGHDNMIHALKILRQAIDLEDEGKSCMAAAKTTQHHSTYNLWSFHPSLHRRIQRLYPLYLKMRQQAFILEEAGMIYKRKNGGIRAVFRVFFVPKSCQIRRKMDV